MIRTGITILSLSFATAWFLWSQLHWHFLKERNAELEVRLSSITSMCSSFSKNHSKVIKERNHLAQQVWIHQKSRPGRKEHLAELKKLIKERNIQYGIGGN